MSDLELSQKYDELQHELMLIKISQAEKTINDHEKRLRSLEETAARINAYAFLIFGGGIVSAVALFKTLVP